jgi:outer membrane protein assembly factor BamB
LNNLVLLGGRITYGAPGFFIAVDAATGSLAWREDLPVEPGFELYGQVVPMSPPLFSADGLTAYIAADVAGDGASPNPYSCFYG